MFHAHWKYSGAIALFAVSGSASADVVLNEVLGSTTGTDSEYIELYNAGPGPVDIGGWRIELWDSDSGSSFGGADGGSPYVVPDGVELGEGQFFLFANSLAQTTYTVNPDVLLPDNAIENSSYTIVLKNAVDDVINSVFVTDGGDGDLANIAGVLITPDLSFGPDGSNLPAGFYRVVDGGDELGLLEFSPQPSPSGTPTSSLTPQPEEPQVVTISEIQGTSHTSPFVGMPVVTSGVVTAVDSDGFYVQDPVGDGDVATSDGLFLFTSAAPAVAVGDLVELAGVVSEFFPGGESTGNLSTTEIAFPEVQVIGSGEVPAPVVLGASGRVPPTQNIDDDAFASFDATTDGIDFFESLEAMRVTVPAPLASSPTNRFEEIFVVGDGGVLATGLSARQTLNISPDDFNPEKIQIDADAGILPDFEFPFVDTGVMLGDVTGVISYDFGNFQIHPTETFDTGSAVLAPEVTAISGADNRLTIASYNVLNLDPKVELVENVVNQDEDEIDDDVGLGRFAAIAAHIVDNLNQPDIVALQEIQDNDGAEVTEVSAADVTLQTLVDAIVEAGGPVYAFLDTPGIVPAFFDNGDVVSPVGGQPGGNIRVGFLYNPERVSLIGDALPLTDPADQAVNPDNPFFGGRISLAANFEFNGETVTVVNNHFSSKGGSAPIFGVEQPFEARQEDPAVNGSLDERQAQATAVNDFVSGVLAADLAAKVVVLGDMNEFEFISPLSEILGQHLTNTTDMLDANERYSFIFQGNSQQLDHILLSDTLVAAAEFDIVHVNSEFAEVAERASDHDPLLVGLDFEGGPVSGDLDADGDVDRADLTLFLRAFGTREGDARYMAEADLNSDGRVGLLDLREFLRLLR